MIECLLRASEGTYKARSQVNLYMGSLYMLQSFLRRLNRSVHVAYERMDFVQQGSKATCLPWSWRQTICARIMLAIPAASTGAVKIDLFPPAPHHSVVGATPNFSQPFLRLGFIFTNFLHNFVH
jgi:hypothetical protein